MAANIIEPYYLWLRFSTTLSESFNVSNNLQSFVLEFKYRRMLYSQQTYVFLTSIRLRLYSLHDRNI